MMRKIMYLLLSISLQNCKSDVEKVQENAQSFIKNFSNQKHLSKSFIQTFGVKSQSELANLKAEQPVPYIYLEKENLKDFETFKNSIEDFKSDTYLVNYILNNNPVSQWTFVSGSPLPSTGTIYTCGTVLNPARPVVYDPRTGSSIPLGLPTYILIFNDFEYEIFKNEGALYGRQINSETQQSIFKDNDLSSIYKQIISNNR